MLPRQSVAWACTCAQQPVRAKNWVGLGGPKTHLEMLAWGRTAGRRYFLMGHGLGVSWDLIVWLHTLVFLVPGPGTGGWVP